MQIRDVLPQPKGRVRKHLVFPGAPSAYDMVRRKMLPPGFMPQGSFHDNLVLYEWGAIAGPLLARQGLQYGISGMYIEFENVASPGDPVTPPALSRDADQGVTYYNGLSGSLVRDYLRIPLTATTFDSSDSIKYPKGNRLTFFAQTSGVVGVHGKTFADSSNSTVFGCALVAMLDEDDPTQDRVLSRFYFLTADQQPKLSTGQVGIEWELDLQ